MQDIVLLNNMKFKGVKNLALFEIKPIPSNIDISKYDALVFTSKNAIYSLSSFNSSWQTIDSYAIAPKTAEVINKQAGRTVFIGEKSHGNEFAKELIPLLKNKKALYVRAKKTVSKLTEVLRSSDILIDELIAYETVCSNKENIKINEDSIIVFSSPSSVECFFKKYEWKKSYKAVVIGNTTAKYMPENIDYLISPTTSLEKCVEVAKSLRF